MALGALRRWATGRLTLPAWLDRRTVVAYGTVLGLGGGAWSVAVHHAAGAREAGEPSLLVHMLRDSALAVPVVALGVVIGLLAADVAFGALAQNRLVRLARAALVAVAAAWMGGAGGLLHGVLFRTTGHGHGHAEPAAPLHVLRDAAVTVVVDLPLALVLAGVLAALAARRARGTAHAPLSFTGARRPSRLAVSGLAALGSFVAPLALVPTANAAGGADGTEIGTGPAGALDARIPLATTPGSPCPPGAPARSYDVTAISLNIPFNRFDDHDPAGMMFALTSQIPAIRAEETSRQVSIGLRTDPIQPLVLRANEGDCVTIAFANEVASGSYGIHIDGLSYAIGSAGTAVGRNAASAVPAGGKSTYVYYVPDDVNQEGAHYLSPGPGTRYEVGHGLFGAFVVEPKGSTWWDPSTPSTPAGSQWEATIVPPGRAAFREHVLIFSELGDEETDVFDARNAKLPTIDPLSEAYRPGTRLINYRTEPFYRRMINGPDTLTEEAHGYSSYMFGDPSTPIPRGYVGDPTKFRILHAGSEMFHVYHMHGGGIRWRMNPHSDPTFDYGATGLNKNPIEDSDSTRLDSQAFGPGESYDLEIEGGAGGVQQGAGEFLFHCHISHHYVAGMWSFWRVYDVRQLDLVPLPDRNALPFGVDSSALMGKNFNGVTLTAQNLADWVQPQLPAQGVRTDSQDATVWDWAVDKTNPSAPVYLGEPEDTRPWADFNYIVPNHPTAYLSDHFIANRPKILFDPLNGRPAFPVLRAQLGKRPPFSPNGHSGAPYLGETADQTPTTNAGVPDPWAGRADGICPAQSPVRTFNITAIELPIQVTPKGGTDPNGMLFVLAKNTQKVRTGAMPSEPLAIRANVGDCVAVTLTSEETDSGAANGFAKVNLHIHHVQFDTQASDGVISGMSFEQSIRPYQTEDVRVVADAPAGSTAVKVAILKPKYRPGVSIAVGQGTDGIEIRTIASVDVATKTITLTAPLARDHLTGEYAGTEFVQSRWYPDVKLDNIFWHDHTDGIHNWGHGLVGQLIIEPRGATYHDPKTGVEVDSGALVDIHTSNPLSQEVTGSYRELALWVLGESPVSDATLNLRATPFSERSGDPANRLSSYVHGDPNTPLPRAYPGDQIVVRALNVGPNLDTLHFDGSQVRTEMRAPLGADGLPGSAPTDTVHFGVSEKFTLVLGGTGAAAKSPGDYLYMNGIGRHFRQGAWGILRVLANTVSDLRPLPGRASPPGATTPPPGLGSNLPAATPTAAVCPTGSTVHDLEVSAVDLPLTSPLRANAVTATFVATAGAAAVKNGTKVPEPYVVHVAEGQCVHVRFTNQRTSERASFHLSELQRDVSSSGVNIGYNPENTVAPGATRDYWSYAADVRTAAASITDMGGDDTGKIGLYGVMVVSPKGSRFLDAYTGLPTDVGSQVVVLPGTGRAYRDVSFTVFDDDPRLGQNHMPYPTKVSGPSLLGYQSVATQQRPADANLFSSYVYGDPNTGVFTTNPGDEVRMHALAAPGSEQGHAISLGGQWFAQDPDLPGAEGISTRAIGAWESFDAHLAGVAPGDYVVGDQRRAFTEAGMWALLRSVPASSCEVIALDNSCAPPPARPVIGRFTPSTGTVGTTITIVGSHLAGATAVRFGGTAATSFTVVDDATVTAVAPDSVRTGPVTVVSPDGTVTSAFAFVVPTPGVELPVITSFSPGRGKAGDTVTITGSRLFAATRVRFAGINAVFTASGNDLVATVPIGAASGPITVDTAASRATSDAVFTMTGPPVGSPALTGFSPAAGLMGTSVTITGTNLASAQVVMINEHPTQFSVVDDTSLTLLVPPFGDSGPVSVQTAGGRVESKDIFTVASPPVPVPVLIGTSVASGTVGNGVLLNGKALGSATQVTFGGVPAKEMAVVSGTQLFVVIPDGAKNGYVLVTTPGGTARSPKQLKIKKAED